MDLPAAGSSGGVGGEVFLVFSTFASREAAEQVVRTLVEERLVACGNIVPAMTSIYRWKGEVETAAEVFVIFKTTKGCLAAFETRLRETHPYEVPEIIVLPVQRGLPEYLAWVADAVAQPLD